MTDSQDKRGDFIAYLCGIAKRNDRGALADLRADLSGHPSGRARACKHVVPFLGDAPQPSDDWFYVVGGLFAHHPNHNPDAGNLGASLQSLKAETKSDSLDKRFLALIAADAEDVPAHLRGLVGQLASKGVSVNWYRLMMDLCAWDSLKRDVQMDWARSYYKMSYQTQTPTDMNDESEQTDED